MFEEFQTLISAGNSPKDVLKELANRKGYDLNIALKQGKTVGQVLQEMSAMPELETGILSAIPAALSGLARGVASELPKTLGTALQMGGRAGIPVISPVMEQVGKGLESAGEAAGRWLKEGQPKYGGIPGAVEEGMAMLAPSLASIPIGGALGKLIQGTKAMSPMASQITGRLAAPFALFGASSAEQALREAQEKGLPERDARLHALESALIEGAGETLGTYMLGRILNVPAKLATESGITGLKKIAASPLARALAVEPTTEVAQETLHGLSRQRYGLTDKSFGEIVDEALGVFFPSVVMTLATFGLAKAAKVKPQSLEDIAQDLDKLSKTEFEPKYTLKDIADSMPRQYRNIYQQMAKVAPDQMVGVSPEGQLEPTLVTVTKAFPKQWSELSPTERDLVQQAYDATFGGLLNSDQIARLHNFVVEETTKAVNAREAERLLAQEKEFYAKAQAEYDAAKAKYEQDFANLVREEEEEKKRLAESKAVLHNLLNQVLAAKEAYLSSPEYAEQLRRDLRPTMGELTREDRQELLAVVDNAPEIAPEIKQVYRDVVEEYEASRQAKKADLANLTKHLNLEEVREMLQEVDNNANLSPDIKRLYHEVAEENKATYIDNLRTVVENELGRMNMDTAQVFNFIRELENNPNIPQEIKEVYIETAIQTLTPQELKAFFHEIELNTKLSKEEVDFYVDIANKVLGEAAPKFGIPPSPVQAAIPEVEVAKTLKNIPIDQIPNAVDTVLATKEVPDNIKNILLKAKEDAITSLAESGSKKVDKPSLVIDKNKLDVPKRTITGGKVEPKTSLDTTLFGKTDAEVIASKLVDAVRALYALVEGNTSLTVGKTSVGKKKAGELAQERINVTSDRALKLEQWEAKYTLSPELKQEIEALAQELERYPTIRLGDRVYNAKDLQALLREIVNLDEGSLEAGQADVTEAFAEIVPKGQNLYLGNMLKTLFEVASVVPKISTAPAASKTTKEVTPQLVIEKVKDQLTNNKNSALNIMDELQEQINRNVSDLSNQYVPLLTKLYEKHETMFNEYVDELKRDLVKLQNAAKKLKAERAKKGLKTAERERNEAMQKAVDEEIAKVKQQEKEIKQTLKNWKTTKEYIVKLNALQTSIEKIAQQVKEFRTSYKKIVNTVAPSPGSDKNYLVGFIFKSINNLTTLDKELSNLYMQWQTINSSVDKNYSRFNEIINYISELRKTLITAIEDSYAKVHKIRDPMLSERGRLELDSIGHSLDTLKQHTDALHALASAANAQFESNIAQMQIRQQSTEAGSVKVDQYMVDILRVFRQFLIDPVFAIGNQLKTINPNIQMQSSPRGTAISNGTHILVSKSGSSQIRGYELQAHEKGKPLSEAVAEAYIQDTKTKQIAITTVLDSLGINHRFMDLSKPEVYTILDKLLKEVIHPLLNNQEVSSEHMAWVSSLSDTLTEAWEEKKEKKEKKEKDDKVSDKEGASKIDIKALIGKAIAETEKEKKVDLSAKPNTEPGWITSLFRSWFFKNANLGLPSTAQHLNSPVDKFLERYAAKLLRDVPIRIDFINKDTVVSRLLDEGVSETALRNALFLHGYTEADIDNKGLNELIVDTFFGATISGENMIPLIFISDNLTPINQIKAGLHELLEVYLKFAPLTETEQRIVQRAYGTLWKEGFIDDTVGYILNADSVLPENKTVFGKIFDWIRGIVHRLSNFVRGDGFKNAEDIMREIHGMARTVKEPVYSTQAMVDFALSSPTIRVKKQNLSVMDIFKAMNSAFNKYISEDKLHFAEKVFLPPAWIDHPLVQEVYKTMDKAIEVRNKQMTDLYIPIGETLEKIKKKNPEGYVNLTRAVEISDIVNKLMDDEVLQKVFKLDAAGIQAYKDIKNLYDRAADDLYRHLRKLSLKYSIPIASTEPAYALYMNIADKAYEADSFQKMLREIGAIRKNREVKFVDISKLESVIKVKATPYRIADLENWLSGQNENMERIDDQARELKRGFYFPRMRPAGNYHLIMYEWHTFGTDTKLVETFRYITEPSMLKLKEILKNELRQNKLLQGKSYVEVHIKKDENINLDLYRNIIKDKDVVVTDSDSVEVLKGILGKKQILLVSDTQERMPYSFYEKISRYKLLDHMHSFFEKLRSEGSAFRLYTNLTPEQQDIISAKIDVSSPQAIMKALPDIRKQGVSAYFGVESPADVDAISLWVEAAGKSTAREDMWDEFMKDINAQINEELKGRSVALSRTIQRKSHKSVDISRITNADYLTIHDEEFISNLAKDANVVRGYNRDVLEVVRDYTVGISEFISRLVTQDKLKDIRKDPTHAANLSVDAQLYDWVTKYTAAIMYPGGQLSRFVQQAKSAATLWFLGGRFSSAFIQLTQLPVVAAPELGMFIYGTPSELATYTPPKTKGVGHILTAQGHALTKLGKAFSDVMLNNLTQSERTALDEAVRKGITMAQFYNDLIGDYHKWMPSEFRQLTKYAMWMFMNAEIKTREAAFVAGYRLATEKGLTPDVAAEFASNFVDKSLFKYGKHAKPLIALGEDGFSATANLALTLKGYQMNYVSWLYDSLKKKNGQRHAEKVLLSFAYICVLGGLFSIPLIGELLDIFSKLFGYPIKEKLLNKITKNPSVKSGLAYGVLSPLLGVDISPSMRLEVIPRDPSVGGIADYILGVWSGSEQKITKAITLFKADQYGKALVALAPAVVEPVVRGGKTVLGEKGLKVYKGDTSLKNVYGKTLVDPYSGQPVSLSLTEGTLSLLGFRPVTLSKTTDVHLATKTIQRYYTQKRNNIYNKLKHADTIKEVMEIFATDVNDYNKRVMQYGGAIPFITGQSIAEVLKNSKGEPNKLAPFL